MFRFTGSAQAEVEVTRLLGKAGNLGVKTRSAASSYSPETREYSWKRNLRFAEVTLSHVLVTSKIRLGSSISLLSYPFYNILY
ncbi:hypothetical protein J6590_083570 [Homalodisca vitripennis]|nr:hypothetical protein J6590_083570 [Homalodisca vitripennis]